MPAAALEAGSERAFGRVVVPWHLGFPWAGWAGRRAEEGSLLPCLFGWLESLEGVGGSVRWWLLSRQRPPSWPGTLPPFKLLFCIFHRDVPT